MMNNPEANFMSPLRTQPAKKQRGGTTPSRGRPPPAGSSTATATSSTGSRGAAAATMMGPPPTNIANNITSTADDAIARRRAELRRLQQKRSQQASSSTSSGAAAAGARRPEVTSTSELLGKKTTTTTTTRSSRAASSGGPFFSLSSTPIVGVNGTSGVNGSGSFSSISGSGVPPPLLSSTSDPVVAAASNGTKATGQPQTQRHSVPGVPGRNTPLRHHSDLFPTAPKPVKRSNAPPASFPPPQEEGSALPPAAPSAVAGGPPPPTAAAAAAVPKTRTTPSPARRRRPPPPPPPVNRRLEFAAASNRAKSAPPARPPPPPGAPPPPNRGHASKEAPPVLSRRPEPVSISNLVSSSKKDTNTTNKVPAKTPAKTPKAAKESSSSSSDKVPPKTTFSREVSDDDILDAFDFKTPDPKSKKETSKKKKKIQKTPHPVKTTKPPPTTMSSAAMVETTPPSPPKPVLTSDEKMMATATTATTATATPMNHHHHQSPPSSPKPHTTVPPPSTTAKRDRVREMLQGAESPVSKQETPGAAAMPSKQEGGGKATEEEEVVVANGGDYSSSITVQRLESAYKQSEQEKQDALKQVKELELKLQEASAKAKPTVSTTTGGIDGGGSSADYLAQMIQVADTQGEDAALKWARSQVAAGGGNNGGGSNGVGNIAFFGSPSRGGGGGGLLSPGLPPGSPLASGRMYSDGSSNSFHHKIAHITEPPTPILHDQEDDALPKVEKERKYQSLFKEAAKSIPYEYSTSTANFVVRRPYGIKTTPSLFEYVSKKDHKTYSQKAHVSESSTVEVAITIFADNSVMCLYGKAGVRYRTNPNVDEFKDIPDVINQEQGYIGTVNYIDKNAMEQSYSLDEIYQEALQLREQYCATLSTTALAFKSRPKEVVVEKVPVEVIAPAANNTAPQAENPKPPTSEMGPPTNNANNKVGGQKKVKISADDKNKNAPPPDSGGDEAAASGDVLALFIGMIFKWIFGFFWWIIIGLPISVVKTSTVSIGSGIVLCMMYLYFMQDYNANLMGHGIVSATSGIHFTNAPGIL